MLTVLTFTTLAIVFVVTLHYEALAYLSKTHFQRQWSARLLMPIGMLILIFIHVVEVWIFGFTYYLVFVIGGVGEILGEFSYGVLDCVYFSFVNYTTLGYGDLVPSGQIRFVAGTESLVGLVMIAWSASFTYLEMQRIVEQKSDRNS